MKSKLRLAIYSGNRLDMAHPVEEGDTIIGRAGGSSLQLTDPLVSKRHAVIRCKGGTVTINDLDTTNGTFVNGVRVKNAVLKAGDRIRIGPSELILESTDAEWVPRLVLDMLPKVDHQTIVQAPRGPTGGRPAR